MSTSCSGSATSAREFKPASRWYRRGKYLVPIDGRWWFDWPASAPRQRVKLAELAASDARVNVQSVGDAESLPEWRYGCYHQGQFEERTLPGVTAIAPYVATLRNGRSYGRQCCVIAPGGEAVGETGSYVPGFSKEHADPLTPFSFRYWRKRWDGDVTSRFWLPPKQTIRGRVAVLNTLHSHNYYHWLCDILPRLSSLRRAGVAADYYLVDCLAAFQQQALAALGIGKEQLIQPHCRLLLEADELLVPSYPTPACWRHFGQWLGDALCGGAPAMRSRRIYISRTRTGKRGLANEAELEPLWKQYGIEPQVMEAHPLAEQARLVREAELIIAPHGAGLANLIFAQPGTQVIEIYPEHRQNPDHFPKLSRALSLQHQQILAPIQGFKQMLVCSFEDVAAAFSRALSAQLTN